MVMQADEQHDQRITLRFVEDGQEVGVAGAPGPGDHEGAGVAHHVHEVDEGGHHAAHDHEQDRELLVDAFEQPVKREYEEDQDHGAEQIAQHAESEEPLVRGDVAGRGGRVAVHEEFVGDVDEAQRAAQYAEQVPEANRPSWIAGRAHVPSVAERVRSQVSGRYATSEWEVSKHLNLLDVHLVQRGTEPVRQLARVVVRPEMHEEEVRAIGQHVAVKGRDGDAVVAQGPDYGVHLIPDHDEVPGDRRLAPTGRLEVDRRRQAHGPRDVDPGYGDRFNSL